MKRALGVLLLLFGAFLVVGGILTTVRDPYDTGRNTLVVIGVLYAGLGVGLSALGWRMSRRR